MTMIVVNINEAKAKLSEFLEAVAKGERVLICKRNQPVAELRGVEQKRTEPRPIGGGTGIEILPSFYDPMSDDELAEFYDGPVYPESVDKRPTRVAEPPARSGKKPQPKRRR